MGGNFYKVNLKNRMLQNLIELLFNDKAPI